jgi:hypothetical protein
MAARRKLLLEPGDEVVTPSGAIAGVVAVYPDVGEVLVQWTSGDRARFKLTHLRKPPSEVEE